MIFIDDTDNRGGLVVFQRRLGAVKQTKCRNGVMQVTIFDKRSSDRRTFERSRTGRQDVPVAGTTYSTKRMNREAGAAVEMEDDKVEEEEGIS